MQDGVKELIAQIRKEEREKILREINTRESNQKPWDRISDQVENWGKKNNIYNWHLSKIKNAVYTIVRYSLEIDRMSSLREEQLGIASELTNNLLEMIYPTNLRRDEDE